MSDSQSLQTPKLIGAIVITAVLLIGIYVLILSNKPASTNVASTLTTSTAIPPVTPTTPTSSSTTATTGTPSASTTVTTSAYKDGTYTASADYQVPHDTNSIQIKITVKNDVITAVSAQHSYADQESAGYISNWQSAITGAVVGKKLNAAQIGRLSGASDTSVGFDQALTTIESQAKA